MRYLDTWSDIIVDASVKVFWVTLAFKSVDPVKQIILPNVVELIQSVENLDRTRRKLKG